MTNKQEFTDTLKYGMCRGSVTGSSITDDGTCKHNSIGRALKTCGYNYGRACNCCKLCRNNCITLNIIKDFAKKQMQKMFEEMAEVQPMDGDVLKPFMKK